MDTPAMLNLVFVDSELETIPEEMIDDYAVRKFAKEKKKPPQEVLLDSNFLHGAIERFFPGKANRMGRPDIFYHMMQVAQSSILNLKGGLRVYIHTKNNFVITIRPETRIPKSYNRFEGYPTSPRIPTFRTARLFLSSFLTFLESSIMVRSNNEIFLTGDVLCWMVFSSGPTFGASFPSSINDLPPFLAVFCG
jgi:hypothetical protein